VNVSEEVFILPVNVLEIENLCVEVAGKRVLEDVNLEIPEGEAHVLLGPNGSGKSSLIMTVLGFPAYRVTSGKILFKGKDITHLPIDERVKMGMGIAFQNPPAIRGVKLGGILRNLMPDEGKVSELLGRIRFPAEFLGRDVNLGFSGGEMKKSEILQILAQNGDFIILDEPDSGVDVENLQIVGEVINEILREKSGLIITHMGYILRYLNADEAHVLLYGTIACSGEPLKILSQILREGYSWCEKCPKVKKMRCEL